MNRQGQRQTLILKRLPTNSSPREPGKTRRTLHSACFPNATRENYWHYRLLWFSLFYSVVRDLAGAGGPDSRIRRAKHSV